MLFSVRLRAAAYVGGALWVMSGLSACTGSQPAHEERSTLPTRPATLNVPFLLTRSIDQLRQRLGAPQEARDELVGADPSAAQLQAIGGESWLNTFGAAGTSLVVTFNPRTRQVHDIVLTGTNEDSLLQRGGLRTTDPHYIVLPVLDPANSGQIQGVRVVPRRVP